MPGRFLFCSPAVAGKYCQAVVCGPFYLVFSLAGSAEIINLKFGHDLTAKIQETVDSTPPESPADLINLVKSSLPDETKIDILVAKLDGEKLVVSGDGLVRAKLLRAGKFINLLGQTGTISGPVLPDDYLFFGTNTFFEEIFSAEIATNQEALSLKMEEATEKNLSVAALVLHYLQPPQTPLPRQQAGQISQITKPFFLRHPRGPNFLETHPKKTLYAALLILVFLISLIAFQLRSRNLETQTKNALTLENQARQTLDSAKKLAGLNDNIARDVILQAKKDFLAKAAQQFGQGWQKENSAEAKRLKTVLADLDAQLATVSHAYVLNSLDTFSDFSLLRPNANITSATLAKNQIAVVDSNNGAIYSLGTKTKTAAIVGGAVDFKQNPQIDFVGENYYVFTPTGIYTDKKLLIKPSEKWGQIKGLKTFGGNIYLLDAGNSQIWKYQNTDLGFTEIAPYLRTGSADLSKTISFAIDGSIYVLSSSGNVAKFSGGYPEDFTISGLEVPLSNPASLFTSDEVNNLYILDSGNNRVVILDKKGIYQSQYALPSRSPLTASCLLADEVVKKVFLFSGSKVYSFDLR